MNFDIIAIGRLSGQLRVSVQQIEKIAKRVGIQPAGRINNVVHFNVSVTERIAEVVRESQSLTTVH